MNKLSKNSKPPSRADLAKVNELLRLEISRLEEELRKSKEHYALLNQGSNDGLWYWDFAKNEIDFSAQWKAILGYEPDEIGGHPDEWFNRVHRYHAGLLLADLNAHIKGLTPHFECQYRMLHKSGNYRWIFTRGVAVRDGKGKAYAIAGSQTDVTERVETIEKHEWNALYDPLTGLPNRALATDLLNRSIKRAKRKKNSLFAVLYLDLDFFKKVNDSLGHAIGDQLLVGIADNLKNCLRVGDVAARFGGDEFVILLDDIQDVADATSVAERVRDELIPPFNLSGHEVFTTASIGIALSTTGYQAPEEFLRDAEMAMHHAKSLGRNRHELFDQEMHVTAIALWQMEHDLRRALERREFQIHYQPIVSLDTSTITGFEALVRWQHPERGLIYPMDFIPLAEETGLIIPICWWVLREACRQLCVWQKKFPANPPLSMSMNFTSTHFAQAGLVHQVEEILQETGLTGEHLTLEITESTILRDVRSVTSALSALKELKVQLHIDDFGTGYSSLSYLHRFPIDALKIDRSFIGDLGLHGENSEIVRTIVTLAHILGMDVVAEGIEKLEQISLLRDLECEYGQGFYFSKAVEAGAAEALLAGARSLLGST